MAVRKFGSKGWQADFYAGPERIRKVFPTKKQAVAYEGKVKKEILENKYFDVQREAFATFSEMLDWYLNLPEARRKKSYGKDIQRGKGLAGFFGEMPTARITPEIIQQFIEKRLNTVCRTGNTLKPASINRELALFKTVFNKAYRNGKTHNNPAKSISMLKGEERRDRVLSDEEWEAYYGNCPYWYKPISLCAYLTAMREGEILNLKWDRVDRKTGFIRLRPGDTKTSEGRAIPIDPQLDEALGTLPRPIQKDGFVFTRKGQRVRDIRHWHLKACKEAQIENFWFHDFRHTCTTNWRRKGVDYLTIMKATGHKTLAMFQRYNTVGEEDLKALVRGQSEIGGQKLVNSGE